jgi:hypothetical protein
MTTENYTNILEEITSEIEKIGNVEQPNEIKPTDDQLKKLYDLINSLPKEETEQLMKKIMNSNVNPNGNDFSEISEKKIRQQKLKKKLEEAKYRRLTKASQKLIQEKNL